MRHGSLHSCARPAQRAIIPCQALRAASSKSKNKNRRKASPTQAQAAVAARNPVYPIAEALDLVKDGAKANFDETVEVAMVLNVDPRKANQTVRGTVQLPKGSGKTVRVAVFAKGDDADAATAAGADIVGTEDLVASVMKGNIDFERCVATPEMMSVVGRAARVLGPRGLMPNAKLGSVTRDVEAAVRAAKGGQAQFRAGKNGALHMGVGKVSFARSDLIENVRATMVAISNLKPEVIKGKYISQVHLSSTMGKGVPVEVATVDPSSPRFMFVDEGAEAAVKKALEAELAKAMKEGDGAGEQRASL
ncbi:conserved unknown protein [Ectocarpus siliculosus]|uniref:Large ribosomal subunit protein uL1c n=1 Tax=Ectocarpus siliculosus TaxID=2880 RepID=D8LST1_ECTSI|nr:conserved unknown protein [Ectocarpus siliculosus]|eukprot:CBN75281.1 conserved unknown protein [Ectocarpus siliculosus]